MLNDIKKILPKLISLKPVSIISTGSLASGEGGKDSDLDLILVFKDDNYVSRSKLRRFCSDKIRIYPFKISEIIRLKSPIPFPDKFYFLWISQNSQAIYGKNVLKDIKIKITEKDLVEVISFERGVALSAMHSFRSKDKKTARISLSKSCLFGTAAYIRLLSDKNVFRYKNIVAEGKKILPQYCRLIRRANDLRIGKANITERDIFENIKYLHSIITKIK